MRVGRGWTEGLPYDFGEVRRGKRYHVHLFVTGEEPSHKEMTRLVRLYRHRMVIDRITYYPYPA